jgi:hypothetical protein
MSVSPEIPTYLFCSQDTFPESSECHREISVPEAVENAASRKAKCRAWVDEYHRGGIDALKVNKKGFGGRVPS